MEIQKIVQRKFLDYSAKYHHLFSAALMVLILAVYISRNYYYRLLTADASFGDSWIFSAALLVIFAAFVLLLLFWLGYVGWYYIWFRFVVYSLAWFYSLIRRLLANKWIKFVLLYTAILMIPVTAVYYLEAGSPGFKKDTLICIKSTFQTKDEFITLPTLLVTLIFTIFIALIARLIRASRRVVITPFTNYTGNNGNSPNKGGPDKPISGIPDIFQYEFGRVQYLLKHFEENRPKPLGKGLSIVDYTVDIKDLKAFQELIGPEQNIKIGNVLSIPINWLIKAVSLILRGPVLSGSLHREGEQLILIGSIQKGKFHRSWRVYSSEISDNKELSEGKKINRLAERLAHRMVSELLDLGSPNWRAAHSYTKGLFDYREAMLSTRDRYRKLQKAKRSIEQALRLDDQFPQCYHNLGNIHLELGNKKAAEAAFRKAIEIKPDYARCYYKLAQIYFDNSKYIDAAWFCNQAITLDPTTPIYWNLRGAIGYHQADKDHQKKHIRLFMNASALSWKTVCLSIITGKKHKESKQYASVCLRNLAVVRERNLKYETGPFYNPDSVKELWLRRVTKKTFKQAFCVNPNDGDIYFGLGRLFLKLDQEKKAYHYISKVFEDNSEIETFEFWFYFFFINIMMWKYPINTRVDKQKKKRRLSNLINISNLLLVNIARKLQYHQMKPAPMMHDNLETIRETIEDLEDSEAGELQAKILTELQKKENLGIPGNISLRFIFELQEEITGTIGENDENNDKLYATITTMLEDAPFRRWTWARGMRALLKAEAAMKPGNPDENEMKQAVVNLVRAIRYFDFNKSREVCMMHLYCRLAHAYIMMGKYDIAILYAIQALKLNPFGLVEQSVISEAYVSFKAAYVLKQTKKEMEDLNQSFRDVPGTMRLLKEVGDYYVARLKAKYSKSEKEKIFRDTKDFFKIAKKLLLDKNVIDRDEGESPLYHKEYGILNYYKGLIYLECGRPEASVRFFREAARYGYLSHADKEEIEITGPAVDGE
jgi:tetratricopeptide (TPR) repeat protein